jgi:hypothetical protein
MLRPLCFAKWDKIFYFSGQQWPRDAALVTERDEKPLSRDCRLAGRSGDGLAFLLDLSAHGEVRRVVALKRGVGDHTPERFADHPGGSDPEPGHSDFR